MRRPTSGEVLAGFDDNVFVNCPFDDKYKPLMQAMLFTIHDCGFVAQHALQDVGGRESRLDKIYRLIETSRWSIHDVSRVELSKGNRLPRFNMPFECGVAFGAMRYGAVDGRDALVMAGVQFQDKASISDLAGIDPGYHGNDQREVVSQVRRFLAAKRRNTVPSIRGHAAIHRRLNAFLKALPSALRAEGKTLREIASFDYINDWLTLAILWIAANPD